ncbi:hypothetical protein D0N50_10120 [Erwinia billingiae]|uniref:hypothetical protein n=1 Tax=Erwinia billingiae TaxID=182337 RepID=UPI0012480645|nr:hypothetical protein [Erwinia billingiae]QEW32008.1 hypothetical protein D0N50_10120 [Erwinia billingiae]
MEWDVVAAIPPSGGNIQILKVISSGDLKFIIWVKSNLSIPVKSVLTPVIDGYIANKDKGHFVAIQKVEPYCVHEWLSLQNDDNHSTVKSNAFKTAIGKAIT